MNFGIGTVDLNYFVYEVTQILGIPTSAISDVTVDVNLSSASQTVIDFVIWNDLKADGTRVDPVAASLKLKQLAEANDPSLAGTSYLSGMAVIDNGAAAEDSGAASVVAASVAVATAVVALL